jgi:non-specific serine/threonine protein kinase
MSRSPDSNPGTESVLVNLPAGVTSFIGRVAETERALGLLSSTRLLTLTGAGGSGKTRLALHVAARVVEQRRFPDGVSFVPLAPLTDWTLVAQAIATTVGAPLAPGRPALDSVTAYLTGQELLLVLDNFEHVIEAAEAVGALLANCPRLRVVVTSRSPLRLRGEQELPVPPLGLPQDTTGVDLEALQRSDAVALFVARACEVRPDFTVTTASAPAIAGICRRLDGLPLAIELAAARVKLLTPQALLERLAADRRLPLLTGGPRDLPARQQTLSATIAWSYDLLTPDLQRLYRHLAPFMGGWTLEAAEAVFAPSGGAGQAVLDGLGALVDHNLVRQREQTDGTPRFEMLETIREYGLERLAESGEAGDARRRHARYFVELAERAAPNLNGPQQRIWLDHLEAEHDNLRVALGWAIEHDPEAALRAAGGIWEFWRVHSHLSEGRRWLDAALANGSTAPASVRATALDTAGGLASWQGDFVRAEELFNEGLSIFRELGDQRNVANTLRGMCRMAQVSGDYARAESLCSESAAIFRNLGDKHGLISALLNLGWTAWGRGDLARATSFLTESLTLAREQGIAYSVANLLAGLGYVALDEPDDERAHQLFTESLVLNRDMGNTIFVVVCLEGLARTAVMRGQLLRAAKLFGTSDAWRELLGFPVEAHLRPGRERDAAVARARLGNDAFAAASDAGRAMPLEDVVRYALDPEPPVTSTPDAFAMLTARELDVLRLVVEGLSDREIAANLFISHHTVMRHVSNILGKLGVESRTAAAAYAMRRDLV